MPVDPISYKQIFSSSCDVPCDVLLGSVCQKVIDSIPGETHEITVALMHVDELVYAIVGHNATGEFSVTHTLTHYMCTCRYTQVILIQ